VGFLAAVAIAAAITVLVAVPGLRHLFSTRGTPDAGDLAFQTVVRVPIGTALPEEVIFRGALLGLFLQRHSRASATAITSVLFGLWHIFPTIDRLAAGASGWPPHGDPWAGFAAVVTAVAATTAAGFAFAWLRFRSDSVMAPVLAHASFDSCGLLAARFATTHPA
jgi:membrane protease YdiL (CAAX protease family)